MAKRFFALWFRQLKTDYFTLRNPALAGNPLVLTIADHGRKIISAVNALAAEQGLRTGMTLADARVLLPSIEALDDRPALADKLLHGLALWCVRYTPIAAVDPPDGLLLDISGCTHLWDGERPYLKEIVTRLRSKGYDTRGAIADTPGGAWAIARFGRVTPIIESDEHIKALLPLPTAALRLHPAVIQRLHHLGLYHIENIAGIPRKALRRRFGEALLLRLDQAFGREDEPLTPVLPIEPFQERLPCLEPIRTAGGIGIALARLLETLCRRLQQEGKGLRTASFTGYRVDGKIQQIGIGTNRATHNAAHLLKLFEEKIPTLEPDLGFELFTLDAPKVEDLTQLQKTLWSRACGVEDIGLAELIDRIANKMGGDTIHRYLPDEHYWPERSFKPAASFDEKPAASWPTDRPRPIHLLAKPDPIEVAAPIPDYPPMHFRYKGKLHQIKRSEGPERIEQEWWLEGARHRDYYCVEDQDGARYWVFRSGHYTGINSAQWYLHGFFA